jgi:sporulation protein YlmC with PRC-barrel domain
MSQTTGRAIDVGLEVLDRQIVDSKGRLAGKVDDLELALTEDGTGPPYAVAIISGPGALARRLGGRLGAWIEAAQGRLHDERPPHPARVPFSVVKSLGNHVEVSVERSVLESDRMERWIADHVIRKIPGAEHEAE